MKTESEPATTDSEAKPKGSLFEPMALVLLSLATVGTAWCSFQASSWGGAAAGFTNRSEAARDTAAIHQLQSSQMALLDVLLFSQYMNARGGSNEALARFYAERFRGEAKAAFNAWMAMRPFENPDAPPHPFVTNFYRPLLLTEARGAEAESKRFWQQAGEAGRVSRGYVLITVLLACSLFCGGTAPRFERLSIRRGVLGVGLVAFVIAATRLVVLPIQ
jgi:hypothetical protein